MVKKREKKINLEVRKKVAGYVTAALGLVTGLAWNEAIKSLLDLAFPAAQDTVAAKFLYAVALTIVIVVISFYLVKILRAEEK